MASVARSREAEPPERFVPPAFGPLPKTPSPLGVLRSIRTAIDGWPAAVFDGGLHRLPLPGAPVIVSDVEMAAEILNEKKEEFPRGERINRLFRPVWGRGIFVSEGADWRWQRRAGGPAFRPAHMAALVPLMRTASEHMLAAWASMRDVELQEETRRLTLQILFDCALSGGEDFPDLAKASAMIDLFLSGVGRFTVTDLMPMPERWRPSITTRGGGPAAYLRSHVGAMVARRRAEARPRGDLVDLLIDAVDPETGNRMDDGLVRDNLLGFIAAGHETSARALAWALWLVASHGPTEARILAEVESVAGAGPIEADHLDRLVFTRRVVQETMRLYPGAIAIARQAARDTTIGGRAVRRGTLVTIAVYALHRRSDYWPDPDAFDPDRFAPERCAGRPPLAYQPFGAGPRICMGAAFAMTELVVALATLVRGARIVPDPAHRVEVGVRIGATVANNGLMAAVAARSMAHG